MKYYCFIECDGDGNIITFPFPYFNIYKDIPVPFFTLDDVKEHNGFNSICKTNMKKIINGKVGNKIIIGNLARGSNWGPLYHAIYIVDEENELYTIYYKREMLKREASELREQLQENELYKELKRKENELVKINKRYKEIIGIE